MTKKTIYIISLAVVMVPFSLKKKLREVKLVSVLLFITIGLFFVLFII